MYTSDSHSHEDRTPKDRSRHCLQRKNRMHTFILYDLVLPAGASVVTPDAVVGPGAGCIVVAIGPEVVTADRIQCHFECISCITCTTSTGLSCLQNIRDCPYNGIRATTTPVREKQGYGDYVK